VNRTNESNTERRSVNVSAQGIEIRSGKNGSKILEGKAIVYNALSEDLGGFREKHSAGAYTQSLKNIEVLCLYAHDDARILGRQSSGTLTITDKPDALYFRCELPNTVDGQLVEELAKRGDLKNMSFGFVVDSSNGKDGDTWQQIGNEIIRTVNRAKLFEVSVVGTPAFTQSTATLASRNASPEIKARLLTRDDSDDESDVDNDDECGCECDACQADDCKNCSDADCTDETCSANECAMQKRNLHVQLLLRRAQLLDE
jgi:Escherichia/Staphylococcus phage prohead protease